MTRSTMYRYCVLIVLSTCRLTSSFQTFSQPRKSKSNILLAETSTSDTPQPEIKSQFCVTGISPSKETPLNEAVSRLTGVSLQDANELIEIGAVWARMDTLTEEDILAQYENDDDAELFADLPKGWGSGEYEEEELDLDEYIAKMESQRFRRLLSPL